MSDDRRKRDGGRRVKLPDGSYGVYMGQTGSVKKKKSPSQRSPGEKPGGGKMPGEIPNSPEGRAGRYEYRISEEHRRNIREAERRRAVLREEERRRVRAELERKRTKTPEKRRFYSAFAEKIYMWWLGISIDADSIVKGVVTGFLIFIFALLQTTVFSRFRLFGAVPDLMLGLVIAVGVTEGEKWGGVCGLICAFITEALGSAATVTLLPLVYVPCGFFIGALGKIYLKDSIAVRCIYTSFASLLRCIVTVIYVFITYKNVSFSLMMGNIIVPEFFSSFIMSALPQGVQYLCMKPFHKSRAERVK